MEEHIRPAVPGAVPPVVIAQEVANISEEDPEMMKILKDLLSEDWTQTDPTYRIMKYELLACGHMTMRCCQIVISSE